MNGDALRGDTGPLLVYNGPPPPIDNSPVRPPVISTDNVNLAVIYRELDPNFRTQYNLQSNGCIHYLVQDPAHPLDFHAIFMTSAIPNTWDDRNTRYSFSNSGGLLWTYNGTIGQTRSGFPWLSMTPNGRALVTMHNTDGGAVQNGQLYVDAAEGLGSFTRLNPGLSNPALGNIWMICAGTNSRAIVIGSQNGADSVKYNINSNYSQGGWLGWHSVSTQPVTPAVAQAYSVAIGNGKWGIAFCSTNGGAYIVESTNEGASWSPPVTVWGYRQSDSTGTLRFIDLNYDNTVISHPRVIITLGHVDPAYGGINPNLPSKEVFWGPDI